MRMKRKFFMPVLLLLSSCSSGTAPSEHGEASASGGISAIQSDFDTNPKIKMKGLSVKAISLENGYLTAEINGLSPGFAEIVNSGKEMSRIYENYGGPFAPIVEMERILKERPDVKSIVWKASVAK